MKCLNSFEPVIFGHCFRLSKADGAKRFATDLAVANLDEDLPIIQQEELDDVGESIPF